jgi:hypothetical protein
MYLRECTIPSKIRSFAFELLELVARPKGAFVFSKGCGVTSTWIAGCGASTGAERAHARRSLASQDRTRLPPAHLGVAAPRGRTGLSARLRDLDQLHQAVAPPRRRHRLRRARELPPADRGFAVLDRGDGHHRPRGCHDRGQQCGPNVMVARVESTLRMKVHDPVRLALNQLSI